MNPGIARRPVAQRLRDWLIARCLAPINLDGSQVSDITIDGDSVSEVTLDGDQVFGSTVPDSVRNQNHWKFDEGSGTSVADAVGSLNASYDTLSWGTSIGLGGAYGDHTGSDRGGLGSSSQSALSNIRRSAGTIGCWINLDVDSTQTIIGTDLTTNNQNLWFGIDSGNIRWFCGDSGVVLWDLIAGSVGAGDGWTPVAATTDGSTARIYSGVTITENGNTSAATAANDFSKNVAIGSESPEDRTFDGGIDDLWVSDQAVSKSDLQTWVNATKDNYGL